MELNASINTASLENGTIFSLDVGTRSLVGIVAKYNGKTMEVLASEVLEHEKRAMFDGQVHDILQVSHSVKLIKEKLEKKSGFKLEKVAIAAAGRVLKTVDVHVETEYDSPEILDKDRVGQLEIQGIQIAQNKLDSERNGDQLKYYCVGFSVINRYLDGYVIQNLEGHRGSKIGMDILATFLPHVVVDSLYTVMNKAGLEVINLTLEPIAAMNAVIPDNIRLLNLCLIDIGAGTSDIAVTRNGSVVAYGMVPVAGDEITEAVAEHYLVDFMTAEKIKKSTSTGCEKINFTDVLGRKCVTSASEVLDILKEPVKKLAKSISDKILEYNSKAPNAVFLVGGGSLTPGLKENLAEFLNMPEDRVAARGKDALSNIKVKGKKLSGPESITPLGIAYTAFLQKGQDFLTVSVNGTNVRLFKSKIITVADALILLGYGPDLLIGKSGKSLTFTLNGKKMTARGQHGSSAIIYVNNKAANLDTPLQDEDNIILEPAVKGNDAVQKIGDIVRRKFRGLVTFNQKTYDIGSIARVNGEKVDFEYKILDNDVIELKELYTLEDLLENIGLDKKAEYMINGKRQSINYILQDNDNIESILSKEGSIAIDEAAVTVEEVKSNPSKTEKNSVKVTGFPVKVTVNGKLVTLDGKFDYMFVDVFNYIDFDLNKPEGRIALKLNGRNAQFTDRINSGDFIDIYWEK